MVTDQPKKRCWRSVVKNGGLSHQPGCLSKPSLPMDQNPIRYPLEINNIAMENDNFL